MQCGIKIWLLTGDKDETAINIGTSSRLLKNTMRIHRVAADSCEQLTVELKKIQGDIETNNNLQHALVIQGSTLEYVFSSTDKSIQELL